MPRHTPAERAKNTLNTLRDRLASGENPRRRNQPLLRNAPPPQRHNQPLPRKETPRLVKAGPYKRKETPPLQFRNEPLPRNAPPLQFRNEPLPRNAPPLQRRNEPLPRKETPKAAPSPTPTERAKNKLRDILTAEVAATYRRFRGVDDKKPASPKNGAAAKAAREKAAAANAKALVAAHEKAKAAAHKKRMVKKGVDAASNLPGAGRASPTRRRR